MTTRLSSPAYRNVRHGLKSAPRCWLVTGAAGFIGSHLVEALLALGQRVRGLDNFSSGKKRNLNDVRTRVGAAGWSRFRCIRGDAADPKICRRACEGVDVVLHHAALVSVPLSMADPLTCHRSNVSGFLNLLCVARDAGVKRFVYASSSAVYGDDPVLPKVEDKTGRPLSPYAASKAMNETYADLFARAYRPSMHRPALLQRVRPAAGSRGRLRRGDPALDRRAIAGRPGRNQWRRQNHPRLLLR